MLCQAKLNFLETVLSHLNNNLLNGSQQLLQELSAGDPNMNVSKKRSDYLDQPFECICDLLKNPLKGQRSRSLTQR